MKTPSINIGDRVRIVNRNAVSFDRVGTVKDVVVVTEENRSNHLPLRVGETGYVVTHLEPFTIGGVTEEVSMTHTWRRSELRKMRYQ